MQRTLRRWLGTPGAADVARKAPRAPAHADTSPGGQVDAAFWIVLGRAPGPDERRERVRALSSGHGADMLFRALLASTEFRIVYAGYSRNEDVARDPQEVEAGLIGLGPDPWFIEQAYRCLLGRAPDDAGIRNYSVRLVEGLGRQDLVKAVLRSEEFEQRLGVVCPQVGVLPRDVQLCELSNPAKWDNPEWMALLGSLKCVPLDKESMHRKGYEYAQTLFGLRRLGRLTPEASVLSVGAGHEPVLYWLANEVGRVVATDMYDMSWGGAWAGEGDAAVLNRPEDYAPFPYRRDRLSFVKLDGRYLAFADASFDIVYSLSSIEHFGGLDGAAAAVEEMGRVLKPGGVLALATEYILSGPQHREAFMPSDVHALITRSGLQLVEPLDEAVHRRYEMAAVDLHLNPFQTPHMAVRDGDTVFTSVMLFLAKECVGRSKG
jgi:SAM-dependent methyltransferase